MKKRSAKKAKAVPEKGGPVNEPPQEEDDEDDVAAYTIEADALRCDICFKPFEEQIFMCKNGHPACGSCCLTMDRQCFCSEPIGDVRCRALEKVLATMTKPCAHASYGCDQTVTYTERRGHEEACRYAPYHCPFEACTYYGLLLQSHPGPPRRRLRLRRRRAGGRALQPAVDSHTGQDGALPRPPAPRRGRRVPPAQRRRRPVRPLALARLHGPSPPGHGGRRRPVQDGGEEAQRPGGAGAFQLRGRAIHPAPQGFPGHSHRVPLRAQLLLGPLQRRLGHGASHRRLVIQLLHGRPCTPPVRSVHGTPNNTS